MVIQNGFAGITEAVVRLKNVAGCRLSVSGLPTKYSDDFRFIGAHLVKTIFYPTFSNLNHFAFLHPFDSTFYIAATLDKIL